MKFVNAIPILCALCIHSPAHAYAGQKNSRGNKEAGIENKIRELSQRYINSSHYTEEQQIKELRIYLAKYQHISKRKKGRVKFRKYVPLNNEFLKTLNDTITLQTFLKANFLLPKDYEVMGTFDDATKKAIMEFQKEMNIPQTGIVDTRTLKKLWFLPIHSELGRKRKIEKETLDMIVDMQDRLYLEGYYNPESGNSELMNEKAIEAIMLYKKLNCLPQTKKTDPAFVNHLGMRYNEKIRRIKEAIKSYSYFHILQSGPHIVINIPEFKARLYYNGVLIQEQKVILGKYSGHTGSSEEEWTTKVQRDQLIYAIINPSWTVPKSIQALMSNPITFVRPGPSNPLGKVAFKLQYAIHGQILHGTPNKKLFEKNVLAFSHGCIRLEKIVETVRIFYQFNLLRTGDIENKLKRKRKTYYVKLKHKIPLDIVYIRASAVSYKGRKYLSLPNDIYRLRCSQVPDKRRRWMVKKIRR